MSDSVSGSGSDLGSGSRPRDTRTDEQIQASLAKPGAGIPLPARLLLRLVVKPYFLRKMTWEQGRALHEKKYHQVLEELKKFPTEEALSKRVLVPKIRGLEDSSRFWSAKMTAEHLVIVGNRIAGITIALATGRDPGVEVDIGKLKPHVGVQGTIDAYTDLGKRIVGEIDSRIDAEAGDRLTKRTHLHPWFGQMTAKDWFCLLGIHTNIHLQQLRAIRKGLGER